MVRSGNWLLVEVLDQNSPGVIAVGVTPKKRISLTSFVRESDRASVKAVVAQCCRRGVIVVGGTPSRPIVADPIIDDQSGSVFGAWVRIGAESTAIGRPSAWPFTWNLETGIARRGPIASSQESWASLGIDQTRSLASGLAHLDIGDSITSLLSKLVASADGTTAQEKAIEHRPDGSIRHIQFFAQFHSRATDPIEGQPGRMVRGVTVDLGPYDDRAVTATPRMGDLIAQATAERGEYRAVMDPISFEFLYWYGQSPDRLRWNHSSSSTPCKEPVLHPDDLQRVQRAVSELAEEATPSSGRSILALRFLADHGKYLDVETTLSMVDLGDKTTAVLAVLKLA